MNINNIHKRTINKSIDNISPLLSDITALNRLFWPHEKWPRIRFKNGLSTGNSGGHGPIRYDIEKYQPGQYIHFRFTKPKGIVGHHKLELNKIDDLNTEIKHSVVAQSYGMGTYKWLFIIRWLHDALLEDAMDKIENQVTSKTKHTSWNLWVRILRWFLK